MANIDTTENIEVSSELPAPSTEPSTAPSTAPDGTEKTEEVSSMIKKINDLLKKNISSMVEPMAENYEQEAKDDNDEKRRESVSQQIENIPISNEFAGMITMAVQLAKAGIIAQEKAVSLIRQFYEFDTGTFLRAGQIYSIMRHKKV